MAKGTDSIQQFNSLRTKISSGIFSPVYILMGEEPYYVDTLSELIISKALQPHERDFNQIILYGSDTSASEIISICSRYPMMAERELVVIKEAQSLKKIDDLGIYLDNPTPTTILVLSLTGKSLDKRTTFYKKALAKAEVFESTPLSQEGVPKWIESYTISLGKKIEPTASILLAEYAGTELRKIVLEIDKLFKSKDENDKSITVDDIEKNIGISREFNATELTDALASKDSVKAFKIAYYFGESPKNYPIQMTLGFLFFFFNKVEHIHAIMLASKHISPSAAATQAGIYSKYTVPYINAVKNYPLMKSLKIISYIKECDYRSKSNARGEATDGELLVELIGKILN